MSQSLEDQSRSISKKLSNLAKKTGVTYQNVCTEFLLERMVARLVGQPDLGHQIVFKGGYVALRVYHSPRFTVDLDAVLKSGNIDHVIELAIQAIQENIGDGVWFQFESKTDLKAQGEYGGRRIVFRTGMGPILKDIRRAQLVNLDIGIGDPIVPGPEKNDLSEILGAGTLTWQVYPIETAAAEKLHTLIVRGSENSRAKDVFDLALFLPKCRPDLLKQALLETFRYRGDSLPQSIVKTIRSIDTTLIKRGWASAVGDIEHGHEFDTCFEIVIEECEKSF